MEKIKIRSTTILGVRVGKKVALGGDGQVTMGDIKMKSKHGNLMKTKMTFGSAHS